MILTMSKWWMRRVSRGCLLLTGTWTRHYLYKVPCCSALKLNFAIWIFEIDDGLLLSFFISTQWKSLIAKYQQANNSCKYAHLFLCNPQSLNSKRLHFQKYKGSEFVWKYLHLHIVSYYIHVPATFQQIYCSSKEGVALIDSSQWQFVDW